MLPLLPLPVAPTDAKVKSVYGFNDAEWKFLVTFLSKVRSAKVLLIDGSNAFYRKPDGTLLHEAELKQKVNDIKRAQGGAKLPVLVVSSKLTYKKSIVGQGVNYIDEIRSLLAPIASTSDQLWFLTIDLFDCGERRSNFCIKRLKDVKPQECYYVYDNTNRTTTKHLFCEFDDVFFTRIYNGLVGVDKEVVFVSFDTRGGGALKQPDEVAEATTALNLLGQSVFMELLYTSAIVGAPL